MRTQADIDADIAAVRNLERRRKDAEIEMLRAQLDHLTICLTIATQWSPIETAPKDGTAMLGRVAGRVRIIQWGKTSHVPLCGFCLADQGVEDFDICEPDGWMPLPSAEQ